jgi:hypothetical protein
VGKVARLSSFPQLLFTRYSDRFMTVHIAPTDLLRQAILGAPITAFSAKTALNDLKNRHFAIFAKKP